MVAYIYRKSDNAFIAGGYGDVSLGWDSTQYGLVFFEEGEQPDLVLHRYDAGDKRLATVQEVAARQDELLLSVSETTSRQKDILATCALIVRATNVAAWNAMSVVEKRNATLAAADVWRDIRVFLEKNL